MASKARLFYSKQLKSGIISQLSLNQSHYIKNVIRLKPGDTISLFNSSHGEWNAIILKLDKDYPFPIVIHEKARIKALNAFKKIN